MGDLLPGPWSNPTLFEFRCPECGLTIYADEDYADVVHVCDECDVDMEELFPVVR